MFIAAAAFFNIVTTLLVFLILFFIFFTLIRPLISEIFVVVGLPFIFIISVFVSFFIYKTLMRFILKKIDTEKYFDPLSPVEKRTYVP
ncbi:hypothetical protein AGMMS50212_09550 [Spirochaetia bacterium]|nr:hypothetical protein AGMMS50212_09550 [Spirochaetia bacterium]